MERTGGQPNALGTTGHGRKIDRLHVDIELGKEAIGQFFAENRITHDDRDNVAGAVGDWQLQSLELALEEQAVLLLQSAFAAALLEVTHARKRSGSDDRGKRGGEDETRRIGADRVDDGSRCRDIAAHQAIGFGQGAFDNVDFIERIIALGNAAATPAIHADGMYFVEIGQGIVMPRKRADFGDRGDEFLVLRLGGRPLCRLGVDVILGEVRIEEPVEAPELPLGDVEPILRVEDDLPSWTVKRKSKQRTARPLYVPAISLQIRGFVPGFMASYSRSRLSNGASS